MKHLIEPVCCWLWFVNFHYSVYFGERYEFIFVVDEIKITMFPSLVSLRQSLIVSNSCIVFLIRAQVTEYYKKICNKCFKLVQLSNTKDIAQLF